MMAFGMALTGGILMFLLLYFAVIVRIAPKSQMKNRIRTLRRPTIKEAEVRSGTAELRDIPFTERVLLPFFHEVESRLIHLAPRELHGLLAKRIMYAGKQYVWSVNAFVCFWVILTVLGFLVSFLFVSSHGTFVFAQRMVIMFTGIAIGGILPFMFLTMLITRRRKAILHQLPEVLDLLCISVQAGLSFDGSLAKIIEKMKGPFIEECDKMMRDMRMGMTRRLALTNMARRCEIPEVHLFTAAIIQSDRMGTSMGKTLVIQADNTRERRRQHAKAQALKAPVKIIFPLVLFIFPALFVVVLVPTLLTLMKNL